MNASAPMSLTMAFDTIAFMPWISDTTVTIDVTATMLPSTVMNERSLFAQMACSAMRDGLEDLIHLLVLSSSRSTCRRRPDSGCCSRHLLAVGQLAHRGERSRDDLVARRAPESTSK